LTESIGKAYKPWLIASLIVLVGSLALLMVVVGIAFLNYHGEGLPLWVVVLGGLGGLGLFMGFGGFFLLMLVAGWNSFRQARRVQVLPPEHGPQA
jgi:hypothetical protein